MFSMQLTPRGATKVGVAPSTTTIKLDGFGNAYWCPVAASGTPAQAMAVYDPYGSLTDMRGLGATSARRKHRHFTMKKTGALGVVDPNEAWNTAALHHVKGTTTLLRKGGKWHVDDVAPPYGTPWKWPPRGGGVTFATTSGSLGITTGEVNRNLSGGLGWFIDGRRAAARAAGLGEEVIERLGPVLGLGTTPNDDELATAYGGCYTPVHAGWAYGYRADGSPYYESGIYGALGDAQDDLVAVERTQTVLMTVSALAVATIAIAAVVGAVRSSKK